MLEGRVTLTGTVVGDQPRRHRRGLISGRPCSGLTALVQGILLGGLYAQYALGMALMFGVMRIVNITHGDLMVLLAAGRDQSCRVLLRSGRGRCW